MPLALISAISGLVSVSLGYQRWLDLDDLIDGCSDTFIDLPESTFKDPVQEMKTEDSTLTIWMFLATILLLGKLIFALSIVKYMRKQKPIVQPVCHKPNSVTATTSLQTGIAVGAAASLPALALSGALEPHLEAINPKKSIWNAIKDKAKAVAEENGVPTELMELAPTIEAPDLKVPKFLKKEES